MIPLFRVFMAASARSAVADVLGSGHVAQGPVVDTFEERLFETFGSRVVTLNSCTSALDLALHLCRIEPGDEVITTAQTCTATNNHILLRGATPVFVDIHPESGLIDAEDVERNLTGKTKAIIAVDWAGHPCDYADLKSHGIPVIEDAAHAVGTQYLGKHVSQTGGDYVCFSFQAIKHLTTGDGGAIKVPDDQIERAERLRWFGLDRNSKLKFRFEQDLEEVGFKYHMNDIAAAIGMANLPHLDSVLQSHRDNAASLMNKLAGTPGLHLPPRSDESSWWLFTIRVRDRGLFIERMEKMGVACSPVHARNDRITAFARAARLSDRLDGLDEFSAHQVSIPVGWWLSEGQLDHIAESVTTCLAQ